MTRTRRTLVSFLSLLAAATIAAPATSAVGSAHSRQDPQPVHVSGESMEWRPALTYVGTFADPDILADNGRWYAYATTTANLRLPTLVSDNLTQWQPVSTGWGHAYDPLDTIGDWVLYPENGGTVWAPSVARMGDGFTAAYSAQNAWVNGWRHNCIGLARSDSPHGPFHAVNSRPLVCGNRSQLGVIDPDLYTDPQGRHWMLWKFSGIARKKPATLMTRQLNADGTGWQPGSRAVPLLTHIPGGWEGNTIENPSMTTYRGTTYLFYSANAYHDARYATGYAICDTPTGPCRRPKRSPLMATHDVLPLGLTGPGGASAFEHNQTLHLMYHAWDHRREGVLRRMHIASLKQKRNKQLVVKYAG